MSGRWFSVFIVLVLATCAALFAFRSVFRSGTLSHGSERELSQDVPPIDEFFDTELQSQSDRLTALFGGELGSVPVFVVGQLPPADEGPDPVAVTVCVGRNARILVDADFRRRASELQLGNILRHELTHAWFCREGIRAGHDARFRQKFAEVGGIGN